MKNNKNGLRLLVAGIVVLLMLMNVACSRDKFIYKSSDPNFDPNFTNFTEKTLNDVLDSIPGNQEHDISGSYISEVLFVSRNGLELTFQTVDGSASKGMHIVSFPEGLSEGQKVRIYYYMSSNSTLHYSGDFFRGSQVWYIWAIERL